MVCLLGFLALAVVLAQIVALVLLAFAPVALVVGVFPGAGHDVFRGWLTRLGTAVFIKALYSLVIASSSPSRAALGQATASLGFLIAFGLQAVFFWAIFLYRKQITARLLGAAGAPLRRRPDPHRRAPRRRPRRPPVRRARPRSPAAARAESRAAGERARRRRRPSPRRAPAPERATQVAEHAATEPPPGPAGDRAGDDPRPPRPDPGRNGAARASADERNGSAPDERRSDRAGSGRSRPTRRPDSAAAARARRPGRLTRSGRRRPSRT